MTSFPTCPVVPAATAAVGSCNVRLRHAILAVLGRADDPQCLIDSLPVPVVQFYHAPQASTEPRANQARQLAPALRHQHWRQRIESVNSQLVGQFHLQVNHARSFWGLITRLHTKLTAHTLCVWLNRLLGSEACLQIKHWAFPN